MTINKIRKKSRILLYIKKKNKYNPVQRRNYEKKDFIFNDGNVIYSNGLFRQY